MEEYVSRYTGPEIDDGIERINNINIFSPSNNGLVPSPEYALGQTFLRDDGQWEAIDISTKISKLPVSSSTNNKVPYINSQGELSASGRQISDFLLTSEKGARNGLATLGSDGYVVELPNNKWIESTEKGTASGVATLDSSGKLVEDANTVNGHTLGENIAAGLSRTVADNSSNIASLNTTVLSHNSSITTNTNKIANLEVTVETLKYQNEWIGSTTCVEGSEQSTLTSFVLSAAGRNPRQGDQVTITNYGLNGQIWMFTSNSWKFYSDKTPITNATTTSKGVMQVGYGLEVDPQTAGKINVRMSNGGSEASDVAASAYWVSEIEKNTGVADVKLNNQSLVDSVTHIATVPVATTSNGAYGAVRFNSTLQNDNTYAPTAKQVYDIKSNLESRLSSAESTLTSKQDRIGSVGSSTIPVYFNNGVASPIAYSIAKSVPSNAVFTDTNTTYSFSGGTNCFYVTPSGGSRQTISITPSVTITKTQQNNTQFYPCGVTAANGQLIYNSAIYVTSGNVLRGASWNDFAEYRRCIEPAGTVVCEMGDGTLDISRERLQAGAAVISDTYGMVIGPEGEGFSPIAVAGRVLAFFEGDINKYKAGAAVCAGSYGKISLMTRDEIKEYPDRILGYVSELPTYDDWNGVSTKDRIWIKIK